MPTRAATEHIAGRTRRTTAVASDGAPVNAAADPVLAEAAGGGDRSVPEAPDPRSRRQEEQAEAVAEMPDSSAPSQPAETASKRRTGALEFIEVWRPGRRDDHPRKPRHDSAPRHRRPQRQRQTPPAAAASDASGCRGPGRRRDAASGGRRGARLRPEPTSAGTAVVTASVRAAAIATAAPSARSVSRGRIGVPSVVRAQRSGGWAATMTVGSAAAAGRRPGDRPDRDPTLRAKYIKGRGEGRDRRDREPDPNSPFAKLAALKEQLEANTKEPR